MEETAAKDTEVPEDIAAGQQGGVEGAEEGPLDEGGAGLEEEAAPEVEVYDPLEKVNRAFFTFNDRLYFRVIKPLDRGYSYVVPEKARVAVKRFFVNIATPVRLANAILQLQFRAAGVEFARFAINTTMGVAGFMDPARDRFGLAAHDKDMGQTLGSYGLGPGLFITWPFVGPSTARESFGAVGDIFLDPMTYVFASDPAAGIAIQAYDRINDTSLHAGEYESVKEEAFDPYVFVRDAYMQHRETMIKDLERHGAGH